MRGSASAKVITQFPIECKDTAQDWVYSYSLSSEVPVAGFKINLTVRKTSVERERLYQLVPDQFGLFVFDGRLYPYPFEI